MTTYLDYMETASKVMRPMRNQHSAVCLLCHLFNIGLFHLPSCFQLFIDATRGYCSNQD